MRIESTHDLQGLVRKGRGWLLVSGFLLLLAGSLGIVWPSTVALVGEVLLGGLFVLFGLSALIRGLLYSGTSLAPGALLLGAAALALGAFLILQPVAAATMLAALVAIVLLLDGIVTLQISMIIKPQPQWRWLLLAALISLCAGAAVAVGLPGSSLTSIGLLTGIVASVGGLVCLFMAHALRDGPYGPNW